MTEVNRNRVTVELGEGVQGHCTLAVQEQKQEQNRGPVDVSALSSMLASKWKWARAAGVQCGSGFGAEERKQVKAGQILRSFKITRLDAEKEEDRVRTGRVRAVGQTIVFRGLFGSRHSLTPSVDGLRSFPILPMVPTVDSPGSAARQ